MQFDPDSDGRAEERDAAAFRFMLDDGHGRRFLRFLMRLTGADTMSDARGLEDLAATQSKRNVGLLIRERSMLLHPEGWLRFEAEFMQERQLALRAASTAEAAQDTTNAALAAAPTTP